MLILYKVSYLYVFLTQKYAYVKQFPDIKTLISVQKPDTHSSYQAECKGFKKDKLREPGTNDGSFEDICLKFSKHLTDLQTGSKPPEAAFCKYINYWFYGALNESGQNTYPTLLNDFYNQISSLNACEAYKKSISAVKYKELDDLYELYDDFNKFKTESLENKNQKCVNGTKCVTTYNRHVGKCKQNYKNGLCINLINFKYEYDDHKMKAKRCVDQMEELDPIKTDTEAIILLPFVAMILISFILIFLYKFTSFGSWMRPKLGGKYKTNTLKKKMQDLHNISEIEGRRYKLPYQTSYS